MTSGWFLIEPIMKKGYDIICECMAAKYFNRKKRFTFFCFVYRHCKVKKEHPVYSHNFGYEPCEKTVSGGAYTRIN